eukprot:6178681-Pleurochrysis_carterae.AAC.3
MTQDTPELFRLLSCCAAGRATLARQRYLGNGSKVQILARVRCSGVVASPCRPGRRPHKRSAQRPWQNLRAYSRLQAQQCYSIALLAAEKATSMQS